MIIDLPRFIEAERSTWNELEKLLDRLEQDAGLRMNADQALRFHYLYQKTAADLARVSTFASEPELRRYLESLVARAYGEIYETRAGARKSGLPHLLFNKFPRSFCRHIRAFALALALLLAGSLFGGLAVSLDPEAKQALLPTQFSHLVQDPSQRVREEEQPLEKDSLRGQKATFSSMLMVNNIRVAILALALGMTWGAGTVILLFYNGVLLGLVAADYILAGETMFLLGWLLPHGATEIPAILIGGQAGLTLAGALIGRGDRSTIAERLRAVWSDVALLALGFSTLLVWAGLVESFFSQYHAPVVPYAAKIAFGVVELVLLAAWLARGQRGREEAVND